MTIFFYTELFCLAFLVLCLVSMAVLWLICRGSKRQSVGIPHSENKTSFAVLIPARYESRVIETNLMALEKLDYPKDKIYTYVIVEDMSDPTVEICRKYENTEVFLRTNLENEGKGHALDECVRYVLGLEKKYDAFMVLDADNVVSPDFFTKMSDAYQAGYEATCGRRDNKDWNGSWVCSTSCLIFTAINSVQNKKRASLGTSITFTGTGFYVATHVLEKLGGWKFFSLTEDYEFSTYAMCNDVKTYYIDDAVYFDEQPHTLGQSIKQRTRWIKGYFAVRFGYRRAKREYARTHPKSKNIALMRLGSLPLLAGAIDIIAYLIFSIVGLIVSAAVQNGYIGYFLVRSCALFALIYVILMIVTVWLLAVEGKRINMSKRSKVRAVLVHPLYLLTYVIAAVRALFTKKKWEVIEHVSATEVSDA